MRHSHLSEQVHVFAHLVVIAGMFTTELEVNDNSLFTVGHYTVRSPFYGIGSQYGTLVK